MSTRGLDGRGGRSREDAGGSAGHELLADRLGGLARSLQQRADVESVVALVVAAAVETVPGAQEASVSAVQSRRAVRTLGATGELPRAVDRLQYETGQGPCLDSLYEHETVRLPDVADEQRWPDFTRRAAELGVGSMLAVQLFVEGDDLGALNLFSRRPGGFDDDAEHVALLLAVHAAVALSAAQERERLTVALGTRDLIGQAKGILMERLHVTEEQAFTLLVAASQASNAKLREIAEELARSGTLPAAPTGGRPSGRPAG